MVFYTYGNPLNSVTKQVTNRNNRFILYINIKTFRNNEIFLFIVSPIFVGIDTLDPDRSYLVNFLFFVSQPFFLSFSFVLLNDQTIGFLITITIQFLFSVLFCHFFLIITIFFKKFPHLFYL